MDLDIPDDLNLDGDAEDEDKETAQQGKASSFRSSVNTIKNGLGCTDLSQSTTVRFIKIFGGAP